MTSRVGIGQNRLRKTRPWPLWSDTSRVMHKYTWRWTVHARLFAVPDPHERPNDQPEPTRAPLPPGQLELCARVVTLRPLPPAVS